jgi:phosphoribosylformylglycinamidine synthase PurS subunit
VVSMQVEVHVSLKSGVVDAEGKNILKAIQLYGFKGVKGVSSSKVYTLEVDVENEDEARKIGEEVSRALLANPVIHEYTITVKGGR